MRCPGRHTYELIDEEIVRARQASLGHVSFEMQIGIDAFMQARVKSLLSRSLIAFRAGTPDLFWGDFWSDCRFMFDGRYDITLSMLKSRLGKRLPFYRLLRWFSFPPEIDCLDLAVRREKESDDLLMDGTYVEFFKCKIIRQADISLILSHIDHQWLLTQVKISDLEPAAWCYESGKDHLGQRYFYRKDQ